MAETLLIKEIYHSIQGESSWAGLPCVFVRLTGCDLRCSYCDSVYAFRGGERLRLDTIVGRVVSCVEGAHLSSDAEAKGRPLVEITGGEPLLQKPTRLLMTQLVEAGFQVLLETSGAHDIRGIHPDVVRIVDLKCPSSGESERMLWSNLDDLRPQDEIKFVIGSQQDYEWARDCVRERSLADRCQVLFSSVELLTPAQQSAELKPVPDGHEPLRRRDLVARLLEDKLPVRFQLQMHKFIWPPDETGV